MRTLTIRVYFDRKLEFFKGVEAVAAPFSKHLTSAGKCPRTREGVWLQGMLLYRFSRCAVLKLKQIAGAPLDFFVR